MSTHSLHSFLFSLSPLFSLAVHVGCLGVSHTSYSPNPKQIGFRHRRKPSVWPSPRRLLRRNPINRQHMAIGYGMDYGLATYVVRWLLQWLHGGVQGHNP